MHVPRSWARADGECRTADERQFKGAVWGWGENDTAAHREAASRLQRLLDRVRRGDPFPDRYAYGSRPLREEILERSDGPAADAPIAVVTRNRYGARVLNTAWLLFLDVDLPPAGLFDRLRRMLSSRPSAAERAVLERLRKALTDYGRASFRIYRTAAGFRAIALDRDFDPAGEDAQALMKASGTDPAFMRLCMAQKSFRARLTPKPWCCKCALPPGAHPRSDRAVKKRFVDWLRTYEAASARYASCRYVETVGSGRAKGQAEKLVTLHDRVTRCGESLPLA